MEKQRVYFSPELRKLLDDFYQQNKDLILEGIKEVPTDRETNKRGSYGEIVELDYDGTPVVGKLLHDVFFYIDNAGDKRKPLEKYCQEIKLLSEMKHENIVQFVGLHYQSISPIPVLVMEKLESSLGDFLDQNHKGTVPRLKTLQILLDISEGLKYLHESKSLAHRDLSSSNILLTLKLQAKIADFGQARLLDNPQGWDKRKPLSTQPGNQHFMAPEALENNPNYSVSVDVFAFGCVIIHLLTHQWPIPVGKTENEDECVLTEYNRRIHIIRCNIDDDDPLLPLIKQCLDKKHKRPTSMDLVFFLNKELANVEGRSIAHDVIDEPKDFVKVLSNTDLEFIHCTSNPSEQGSDYSVSVHGEVQDSDYSVVICGPTGTGKSSAANFFFGKMAFETQEGLIPGTTVSDAKVSTVLDKGIQIIDTPGFFDGLTPPEQTFKELSRAFTLARHGVHAVAFVINLKEIFTRLELGRDSMIRLLQIKDVHPFIFLLFTHADSIGIHKEEADQHIRKNILQREDCPAILKDLMHIAKFRVMMVESCNPVRNATDYKEQKCKQFIEMIEAISSKGSKKYNCSLFAFATEIYENEHKKLLSRIEKLSNIVELKNTEILKLRSIGQSQSEVLNKENVKEERVRLDSEITAHKEECLQIYKTIQANTEIKVYANVLKATGTLTESESAGNEVTADAKTGAFYDLNKLFLKTLNDYCIIQ